VLRGHADPLVFQLLVICHHALGELFDGGFRRLPLGQVAQPDLQQVSSTASRTNLASVWMLSLPAVAVVVVALVAGLAWACRESGAAASSSRRRRSSRGVVLACASFLRSILYMCS